MKGKLACEASLGGIWERMEKNLEYADIIDLI
jgi:hypothetical protein